MVCVSRQRTGLPQVPSSEAAAAPAAAEAAAEPATKLAKRKVALHVGYVGTAYQGLQINKSGEPRFVLQLAADPVDRPCRDPADTGIKTIEEELEEAIYKMGGISEQNHGTLNKIRWSRSSRTDKGVHALATVVAFKMLVDPAHHDKDPEGVELACRINEHLPKGQSARPIRSLERERSVEHRHGIPPSALQRSGCSPYSVSPRAGGHGRPAVPGCTSTTCQPRCWA